MKQMIMGAGKTTVVSPLLSMSPGLGWAGIRGWSEGGGGLAEVFSFFQYYGSF